MPIIEMRMPTTIRRRVFPSWSIEIPSSFTEAFVEEGGYWHAYDEDRSISLTSLKVSDRRQSVPALAVLRRMPPSDGEPVDALPSGLLGWAVTMDAGPTARASRYLSGMLATDGHVLLATITSDDDAWRLATWLSIRGHRKSGRRKR
jgi:hypothetical protein